MKADLGSVAPLLLPAERQRQWANYPMTDGIGSARAMALANANWKTGVFGAPLFQAYDAFGLPLLTTSNSSSVLIDEFQWRVQSGYLFQLYHGQLSGGLYYVPATAGMTR